MKRKRFIKPICLVLAAVLVLLGVSLSASAEAAEVSSLCAAELTSEEFHRIVSESENKLPDEVYANLSLCEDDLPEVMADTGIEGTEAVVRLKGQENELSSLLYANSDGTYTEYFFSETVKFEKDGIVKDKSNKLTYSAKLGGFTNEENDINVILPAVYPSDDGVSLTYGENVISFAAEGCVSSAAEYVKGENGADKVVYKDVFAPGIDLEYFAQFSGVKENIILNEKPQNNTFSFRIRTNGNYLQNENGSIMILDEKGECIGYIGDLYIYDAEGKAGTGSVQIEEIAEGAEYLYILTVDDEYLSSADTVYPVTVDPSFSFGTSNIYDSKLVLDNGSYSLDSACTTVKLGYTGIYRFQRMLIKFTSIKQIVQHLGLNNISAIYLNIKRTAPSLDYSTFHCYRMTANWGISSGSTTSSVWNGYDSGSEIDGVFLSSFDVSATNIKPYYQSWISGSSDYGVMLQCSNEITVDANDILTKEYSSNSCPFISIVYSIPSNLESVGLKDGGLHTFCSMNGIQYPYLQSSALTVGGSTMYSLTLNDGVISTGSTLDNSPFFAVYADGSNGYFKMSPTNANYKGSRLLYGGTTVNYVYYNGSSLGISTSYNSSNKSSWYLIKASSGVCYILNRNYSNVAIYVNTIGTSLNHGAPDFMVEEYQWYVSFVGLDVPLTVQPDDYTCCPACASSILKFYGLNLSVEEIKSYCNTHGGADHYDWQNIADMNQAMNHLLEDNNYDVEYTNVEYSTNQSNVINSIVAGYPVLVNIKKSTHTDNESLPYTTTGHYIVLKGYTNNKFIVSDSYVYNSDDKAGEYIVPATELYGYITSGTNRALIVNN